jgi:DNA-directed RNA polymerase subunit omega
MIYPSIDKLLNIVDSKYALVHVVSRRARQMYDDGFYQMKERDYSCKKNIGRALEEIAEGLIHVKKY